MIGITGWICDDKRNSELLESIKEIPLEKLMIETDAPWLTPKNVKLPRRNVPTNINYVYEKIAELKNIDVDIVKKQTCLNTKNFFNI
jgi:TatD DNase family protein